MIMVYTKLRKIISRKLLLLNSSKNQILHSNIKTKPSGIAALLYCRIPANSSILDIIFIYQVILNFSSPQQPRHYQKIP